MNSTDNIGLFPKDQLRTLLLSQELIEASRNGQLEPVSQLVERHLTPVNYQSINEGTTALAAAVIGGFLDIVKYLVEHGADVNLANLRGETPLHLACLGDNDKTISFLLSAGRWLASEDECGDSPLMYATREDKLMAVEQLLMHGADVDHPNEDRETPRMLAEELACEEVRDLFNTYAGRDVSNAAAVMVPDCIASGALGTSLEMKVDFFPLSKGIRRSADPMDDSDSSGGEDSSSLGHSATVHSPPLASDMFASKHLGVPTILTAGVDRSRGSFHFH